MVVKGATKVLLTFERNQPTIILFIFLLRAPSARDICSILILTEPKFAISQSEAVCTVLLSCDIKSLTWYGYDIKFTYRKYLIVPF